jgi:hypothetical protein
MRRNFPSTFRHWERILTRPTCAGSKFRVSNFFDRAGLIQNRTEQGAKLKRQCHDIDIIFKGPKHIHQYFLVCVDGF